MKRNPPRLTPGGEWSQGTLCIWVIRLRFYLAPRYLALERPLLSLGFSWISLDSLVRIEPFQCVTRQNAQNIFSYRFVPVVGSARRGDCGRGVRKPGIAHQASLTRFPIFCKKLPALIAFGCWSANNGSATASWPRFSRPSTPTRSKPQVTLLEKLIISDDY